MKHRLLPASLVLLLISCGGGTDAGGEGDTPSGSVSEPVEASAGTSIPASLAPFGDGYPGPGDPCRRLGESEATSNYLDDSAFLIGCPDAEAAAEIPGEQIATIDGVILVSVPANEAGGVLADRQPAYGFGDAADPDTGYNATAVVPCGFGGAEPTASCPAGVIRQWGEDGTTLLEITKPDGGKRALYFRGTEPFGADGAEADGSAGWDLSTERQDDRLTIRFGPETYVVVDAFVVGG